MKIVRTAVSVKEDIQKRGVGNLRLTKKQMSWQKETFFSFCVSTTFGHVVFLSNPTHQLITEKCNLN